MIVISYGVSVMFVSVFISDNHMMSNFATKERMSFFSNFDLIEFIFQ